METLRFSGRPDLLNNLVLLEQNDIYVCENNPVWDDKPFSVELETYTNAGEDMIIDLEEPSKACLQEYIDGFDADEQVMLWWRNGREAAKSKGMPHDNIRDHYEDYEAFLAELRRVSDLLN